MYNEVIESLKEAGFETDFQDIIMSSGEGAAVETDKGRVYIESDEELINMINGKNHCGRSEAELYIEAVRDYNMAKKNPANEKEYKDALLNVIEAELRVKGVDKKTRYDLLKAIESSMGDWKEYHHSYGLDISKYFQAQDAATEAKQSRDDLKNKLKKEREEAKQAQKELREANKEARRTKKDEKATGKVVEKNQNKATERKEDIRNKHRSTFKDILNKNNTR